MEIAKGPRGLGLSVSGGVDTNAAFPGLIRIKRLFPHQAAWSTGMLQPGDILLAANGITLTGLTNYVRFLSMINVLFPMIYLTEYFIFIFFFFFSLGQTPKMNNTGGFRSITNDTK